MQQQSGGTICILILVCHAVDAVQYENLFSGDSTITVFLLWWFFHAPSWTVTQTFQWTPMCMCLVSIADAKFLLATPARVRWTYICFSRTIDGNIEHVQLLPPGDYADYHWYRFDFVETANQPTNILLDCWHGGTTTCGNTRTGKNDSAGGERASSIAPRSTREWDLDQDFSSTRTGIRLETVETRPKTWADPNMNATRW